jgi:hypothetical protein
MTERELFNARMDRLELLKAQMKSINRHDTRRGERTAAFDALFAEASRIADALNAGWKPRGHWRFNAAVNPRCP